MFNEKINLIAQAIMDNGYTYSLDETSSQIRIGGYLSIKPHDEKFLIVELHKEVNHIVKSLETVLYLLNLLTIKNNAENKILN